MGNTHGFRLRMELGMSTLHKMYAAYARWMTRPRAAMTLIAALAVVAIVVALML